jgi:hypothetical protein
MGMDSLKSALETDHVPKLNILRAHLCSKGHHLTSVLKEIQWTRTKHLLQWHAKNGHENILFMDKKIFAIEPYNKIYAQKSLQVCFEGAGGHHPSYVMVW